MIQGMKTDKINVQVVLENTNVICHATRTGEKRNMWTEIMCALSRITEFTNVNFVYNHTKRERQRTTVY